MSSFAALPFSAWPTGRKVAAGVFAVAGYLALTGAAVYLAGVLFLVLNKANPKQAQFTTLGRYRLQEWLNFLATEVHKRGSLLINRGTPEPMRATATEQLHQRLGWLEHKAGSQPYLVGERFSIADAHLLFLLHGMRVLMQLDFKPYPALTRRLASGLQRPAVREVLQIEQLSFPSID